MLPRCLQTPLRKKVMVIPGLKNIMICSQLISEGEVALSSKSECADCTCSSAPVGLCGLDVFQAPDSAFKDRNLQRAEIVLFCPGPLIG